MNNYSLFHLQNVSVARHHHPILDYLSFSISKGQIVSIIGTSGSGKTTLLKLLLGVLFPEKGWNITGNIARFPGLRMAWINQNPILQVFKNFVYEEFPGLAKKEVLSLLESANCQYLLDKRCLALSQGEKTMVALLRTFSQTISLIALDEVMVNLSLKNRKWLALKIKEFQAKGGTVILIDHLPEIVNLADTILSIEDKHALPLSTKQALAFFSTPTSVIAPASFINSTSFSNQLELCDICDNRIESTNNKPISILISSGKRLGISGENGCGKSTLLEIICGIKKPDAGIIKWNHKTLIGLRSRKKLLTLITQDSAQLFFTTTVCSELALLNVSAGEQQTLLALFRLDNLLTRKITALSYGERQRLAIVCGLLADTPILVLDEPTYGMDPYTSFALIQALQQKSAEGKIIILATHEASLLEAATTEILSL